MLYYHKIDSYRWLEGSIRQDLEPDERSVWADLLALAALTREPRRGFIERSEGIPYPKAVILARLNITEELFDRAIIKCVNEGRLKVYDNGTMEIVNFGRYNNTDTYGKHIKNQSKLDAIAENVATLCGNTQVIDKKTGEVLHG